MKYLQTIGTDDLAGTYFWLLLVSIAYFFAEYKFYEYSPIVAVTLAVLLLRRCSSASQFIDSKIDEKLGEVKDWIIHSKSVPGFQFVDMYYSAQHIAEEFENHTKISSQHQESLQQILQKEFYSECSRKINPPVMIPRKTGIDSEEYFASDGFWIFENCDFKGIIRVTINAYTQDTSLEVAALPSSKSKMLIERILDHAEKNSIFKNKMFEIQFEPEVRDTYGEIESRESLDLNFINPVLINDEELILDDHIKNTIWRTIKDFHYRRKELQSYGLPGKRGVLFYGPPGTGKTMTSKHLSSTLGNITTVLSTGKSLLNIKSICNVARLFQPSLVILEDVDLVFEDRNSNFNGSALGEFMDQLDGFREDDEIIFILTTNAIERVESAIKDRPGRISQCIYFGTPNELLREKYLKQLLSNHDTSEIDLDYLVSKTSGTSPAFLKELVFRSIQIATEDSNRTLPIVGLNNDHFKTALLEMTGTGGSPGKRIIGFVVNQ